jgi:hypothetical protein
MAEKEKGGFWRSESEGGEERYKFKKKNTGFETLTTVVWKIGGFSP